MYVVLTRGSSFLGRCQCWCLSCVCIWISIFITVVASPQYCHSIKLAVWIFYMELDVCICTGSRCGLAPVWMLWNTLHC